MRILKKLLELLLKHQEIPQFIFKKMKKNWTDTDGNNLYHYACNHHDIYLFNKAVENNANISQANKRGLLPIHTYIECGFPEKALTDEQKKQGKGRLKVKNLFRHIKKMGASHDVQKETSERVIDFNLKLLDLLMGQGADINAFIDTAKRNENLNINGKEICGSPVELLMCIFGDYILPSNFSDEEQIEKYNEIYKKLEEYGAKINAIVDGGIWGESDVASDAMQETKGLTVSHTFVSHIKDNKDLITTIPMFRDKSIDFTIKNSSGNTVLHYLFIRIEQGKNNFNSEGVLSTILAIIENPAFKDEYMSIKNSFGTTPLSIAGKVDFDLKASIEKLILRKNLKANLGVKNQVTKLNKI